MWKIILFFFRNVIRPSDLPPVLLGQVKRICKNDGINVSFVIFKRRSIDYFEMLECQNSTAFGLSLSNLEID